MMNNAYLINDVKAWVKRKNGPDEVVRILLDTESRDAALCYQLFTAFDEHPDYLGRILFDDQGYWIYDGETLSIAEQEQLARFIIGYIEHI
ncbi:MAG: hypothetical protein ACXVJD_06685 [Mucilaginibacter sp.]